MKSLLTALVMLVMLTPETAQADHVRASNLNRKQRHELKARRRLHRTTFGAARRNILGFLPGSACPSNLCSSLR